MPNAVFKRPPIPERAFRFFDAIRISAKIPRFSLESSHSYSGKAEAGFRASRGLGIDLPEIAPATGRFVEWSFRVRRDVFLRDFAKPLGEGFRAISSGSFDIGGIEIEKGRKEACSFSLVVSDKRGTIFRSGRFRCRVHCVSQGQAVRCMFRKSGSFFALPPDAVSIPVREIKGLGTIHLKRFRFSYAKRTRKSASDFFGLFRQGSVRFRDKP